jgi:type II secretion system protein H
MEISATGLTQKHPQKTGHGKPLGFTLIELIIVLAIIAILTYVVTLNFRNFKSQPYIARDISQQILLQLRSLEQRAILTPTLFSLQLSKHAYRFMGYTPNGWQPLVIPGLQAVNIPDPLELRLKQGQNTVPLSYTLESAGNILIDSNGETTPFELSVIDNNGTRNYTLTATATGELSVKEQAHL